MKWAHLFLRTILPLHHSSPVITTDHGLWCSVSWSLEFPLFVICCSTELRHHARYVSLHSHLWPRQRCWMIGGAQIKFLNHRFFWHKMQAPRVVDCIICCMRYQWHIAGVVMKSICTVVVKVVSMESSILHAFASIFNCQSFMTCIRSTYTCFFPAQFRYRQSVIQSLPFLKDVTMVIVLHSVSMKALIPSNAQQSWKRANW